MKKIIIFLILLPHATTALSATGDANDPFYVAIHPTQWNQLHTGLEYLIANQNTIITNQQQFHSDCLFILQTIAIIAGLGWGGFTWLLILKAKNSKRFW